MFCVMIPQVNQLPAFTCHLLTHYKLVGITSEEKHTERALEKTLQLVLKKVKIKPTGSCEKYKAI